jgi:asparagine synthase (glutamine-hydrolysing)
MCGIAGIVSANPNLVSKTRIRSGISVLEHRGPEGEGYFIENNVALAHKRLCIIDLSEKAAQPFVYMNRYHLIHNGEIYNYRELRSDLKKKNYHFATGSDTEVLAASFAEYGKDCLHYLDGMFAFAIWDVEEKRLFAARDRFGEKPFFYYYDGEQLLFASEIKAFWRMNIEKEVNLSMLYNFLAIGYTSNPGDPQETFYHNINKLPAASSLSYSLHTTELIIEKYWQIFPEPDHNISEEYATERFFQLLGDSVKKRMRSDVPVGTSLSGGLDSSAIVALSNQVHDEPYSHKCFTAVFEGFERDERKYAEIVSKKFNLEHFTTTIKVEEVPQLMQSVMLHNDEPISSSSPLAQYKVFALAKENGVKVILDGQGADETLGGYHKYYRWYWQELYRKNKLSSSGEVAAAHTLGVEQKFDAKQKMAAAFPHLASALWQSRQIKSASNNEIFDRDFAFTNKRNLYYSLPATPDLNGVLYYNSFVNGLEELLRMADRNSMAHSIEVRLPFLQHELVEFLFTLPPHFKIRNGWTKWLLRNSMKEILPDSITWRKDKTGYEPPQKNWMKDEKVREAIHSSKQMLVSKQILNKSILQKQVRPHDAHEAGPGEWKFWSASFLFNH